MKNRQLKATGVSFKLVQYKFNVYNVFFFFMFFCQQCTYYVDTRTKHVQFRVEIY